MNDPAGLPLALYQANLELQARIGRLIQESSRHWLDFGQRLAGGMAGPEPGLQAMLRSQDWQALASLPAEAFWRQLQPRPDDHVAIAQIAVAAQTAFSRGLQDAVQDWQRRTVGALDDAGLTAAVSDPAWEALFRSWRALMPPLPGQDAGGAPTPTPAPRKRPAGKPAACAAAAKKGAPRPRR
ncbi:hypothetical protein B1992_05165 [Pseudoxanthomonas broegbernensis]|uniref:Phasin domain-containing protein n=1 Tax=Pseudoxanthomonas broegbernensis TaxID=83619 RepID=A0A7V8GNW7_9GAMM|nr:hypothetical protein [Pseudoxanthomonas broegbernensis]KAF1687365.1 hypothetical protein B1992_05165 [Pseudoxanthomonas broegbernensis]MBB6065632.1 hypothetical protein [Pseudoxanthomonas broegbernensis]